MSVVTLVLFSSVGLIVIMAADIAAEGSAFGTATAAAYATGLAFCAGHGYGANEHREYCTSSSSSFCTTKIVSSNSRLDENEM